jgi:hypothetical protein
LLNYKPCAARQASFPGQVSNGKRQTKKNFTASGKKEYSTLTCCFKTEIHNYSFDARKKI